MLARILKRPSNIMVLDEPTNDLDAESLELLEELISNYPGTLLLVSHDRTFLNNLCTSTLVFEADGNLKEYAGGYDDYTRQRKQAEAVEDTSQTAEATDTPVASTPEKPETARRLSFREQQRADELFLEIGELEDEQQQLNQTMSDPEFFKGDGQEIATATARLADINQQLPERISEWEELESRR